MRQIESFDEFKKLVATDPQLQKDLKEDPVKTVQEVVSKIPDNGVYRIIVFFIGTTLLGVAVGLILMSYQPKNPEALTAITSIGSTVVGLIAGLLTPSPIAKQ